MRAIAVLLLAAGCLQTNTVQCPGGLVCPADSQCDEAHTLCIRSDQLTACTELADGQFCQYSTGVGACDQGVCVPSNCGNGNVDLNEACDDGNIIGADGCSADCKKIESCGDLIVDASETCDDQNDNPADGCDMCIATTWRATPIIGGVGDAASTGLASIGGIALDPSGNLYVVDSSARRVRKLDAATGLVTTFAGGGMHPNGSEGDGGPASGASLSVIVGSVAADLVGNIYIADSYGHKIRRVDPSGIITTFAGGGSVLGDGGPATAAKLFYPNSVVADDFGRVYIADTDQHRVRRVDANGTITTIAGTGTAGSANDQLNRPMDIAVDLAGNVYIADTNNNRIQRVSSTGAISTVVGGSGGYADGIASTSATLCGPEGVSVDSTGALLIADRCTHSVRRAVIGGTITTPVNASHAAGFAGDGGAAASANVLTPTDVISAPDGAMWIADTGNRRVRRVDAAGIITTVAGNGVHGFVGNGSLATSARLFNPEAIARDAQGRLYIADRSHHQVRRVEPDGVITLVAGQGTEGFAGDNGIATSARLKLPGGVAVGPGGDIYIADTGNHRIRRVDGSGTITTIAGTGVAGVIGDDGPATAAQLSTPRGLAVDASGNVYIADSDNHRVRRIDTGGKITTFAGTTQGLSGDNGLATSAQLSSPESVAVTGTKVYIADTLNSRIRQVEGGTITTVAGTTPGFSGDGMAATSAELNTPRGVAVDSLGRLYIADSNNQRIRRVDGTTINTICGAGYATVELELGDGEASSSAKFGTPRSLAVDAAGDVYIADDYFNRVRRCTPGGTIATFAGFVDPESTGPLAQARLADPRAIAFTPTQTFVAGGGTGTVQRISGLPPLLTTIAGRYPAYGPVANRARFRSSAFGSVEGIAIDEARQLVFVTETKSDFVHAIAIGDPDPSKWTITLLPMNVRQPTGLYYDATTKELYVADTGQHVIRALDLSAGISSPPPSRIVAGYLGSRGFAGDNGAPTAARLNAPKALTRCSNGDLFIADTGNHRIRRIAANRITTVLGTGAGASSADGSPATAVPIEAPSGLACDPYGNLVVTSTTTVRAAIADAARVVDGTGAVKTIYGIARTAFPERVTTCLTGIASIAATKLWVTDSCSGLMVELAREPVN